MSLFIYKIKNLNSKQQPITSPFGEVFYFIRKED
nr:MAG TPA: hypothetical protein [Caudoviricetes sp.]